MSQATAERSRLLQLAASLIEARQQADEAESAFMDAKQTRDTLEEELVAEMIDNEIQHFNFQGKTFYLAAEVKVSCTEQNRPELLTWLKDHDFESLVKETVHPSTLRAWFKEQDDADNPVPLNLLNVYRTMAVRVRGG